MKAKVCIALVFALTGFVSLFSSGVAYASQYYPGAAKCSNPHCYLRAVDWHSGISAATAVMQYSWMSMLDQTQNPYQESVIAPCPGSFSTNKCPWFESKEIWMSNLDHTRWVEVGIRNGYEAPDWKLTNGQPGCNCQAYYLYWEDGPGSATENTHIIANISPDNSVHSFTIQRGSGNHVWDIYIDGRIVGVSTLSGENSFGESMIGSETSAVTTVQPLSYINQSCITGWSVRDAHGNWIGITSPNHGFRASHDDTGAPSQTYSYTWNGASHQLCFQKGGL